MGKAKAAIESVEVNNQRTELVLQKEQLQQRTKWRKPVDSLRWNKEKPQQLEKQKRELEPQGKRTNVDAKAERGHAASEATKAMLKAEAAAGADASVRTTAQAEKSRRGNAAPGRGAKAIGTRTGEEEGKRATWWGKAAPSDTSKEGAKTQSSVEKLVAAYPEPSEEGKVCVVACVVACVCCRRSFQNFSFLFPLLPPLPPPLPTNKQSDTVIFVPR